MYRSVCTQKPHTAEEAIDAVDPFGLAPREWQRAYRALQIVRALSSSKVEPAATDLTGIMKDLVHPLEEMPFKVWLLTLIRALAKRGDDGWDRQAHFALIFKHLTESDIRYVRREPVVARNLSDMLRKEACPVEMNVQKLSYWIMMASHLGLVTRVSGGAITVLDPTIFQQILLRLKASGAVRRVSLEDFVQTLDQNLFFVPTKPQGTSRVLSPIISRSIWRAYRSGLISLDNRGDTGRIQLSEIPSQNQVFTDVELRP